MENRINAYERGIQLTLHMSTTPKQRHLSLTQAASEPARRTNSSLVLHTSHKHSMLCRIINSELNLHFNAEFIKQRF